MSHRPLSLTDLMKDMAQRVEHSHPAPRSSHAKPLDQVAAFLAVDPLLADLHKRYLDAREMCGRVLRQHGAGAPLTIVASDAMDSARSAFQTRLIELKGDDALCRKACAKLRAEKIRDEEQQEEFSRAYRQKMDIYYRATRKGNTKQDAFGSYLSMMMLVHLLRETAASTQYKISLMQCFGRARDADLHYTASAA